MSVKSRALAAGRVAVLVLSLIVAAAQVAAGAPHRAPDAASARGTALREGASSASAPFRIVSPDFTEDGWLPVGSEGGPASATGCGGRNLAPALHWSNVPPGTASFAFTITDVDAPRAGTFHHWIVYNIPAGVTTLAGHSSNPYGEGTNDYGFAGYGGPCPPAGQVHHYIFTVYALAASAIGGTALTYSQLISEISPYVIGVTSTTGKFVLPLRS